MTSPPRGKAKLRRADALQDSLRRELEAGKVKERETAEKKGK